MPSKPIRTRRSAKSQQFKPKPQQVDIEIEKVEPWYCNTCKEHSTLPLIQHNQTVVHQLNDNQPPNKVYYINESNKVLHIFQFSFIF